MGLLIKKENVYMFYCLKCYVSIFNLCVLVLDKTTVKIFLDMDKIYLALSFFEQNLANNERKKLEEVKKPFGLKHKDKFRSNRVWMWSLATFLGQLSLSIRT